MAELKKGSTVDGKLIVTEDQISGLAQVIEAPSPVFPLNGEENVPIGIVLSAGNYLTSYPGLVRTGRQFQVCMCDDGDFENPLFDQTVNSNSISVTPNLNATQGYSWRCRDIAGSYVSEWSDVQRFTTGTTHLTTPTINVQGSPSNVGVTPVLTGSKFVVSGGTDIHVSTDWEVRKTSDNSLVWSKMGAVGNDRLSVVVSGGYLETNTEYKFRVRYHGENYSSQWGEMSATTTDAFFEFTPDFIGSPYGGGYYAGNIKVDNQEYALVVAPKTQGGESPTKLPWTTNDNYGQYELSRNDGKSNTDEMLAEGASYFPAANFCNSLDINGYTDWYLPSRDEINMLYRAFKPSTEPNHVNYGENPSAIPPKARYTAGDPAQTSLEIFKEGGSEAFSSSSNEYYLSSTSYPDYRPHLIRFVEGGGFLGGRESPFRVRAVRRVAL